MRGVPVVLRRYDRSWLGTDLVAGVTLAAIAIPEVMGYTSISQTPIVTGLYTVIFPALFFALIGSSRAAGRRRRLGNRRDPRRGPRRPRYRRPDAVLQHMVALVLPHRLGGRRAAPAVALALKGSASSATSCSSSVLIGFLTGVGVQVLVGQIPDMIGVPKGTGNWFQQQWGWISNLGSANPWTVAFAAATLIIILGFRRFAPKIPGALIAVVLLIAVSAATDAASHGVAEVGTVQGGFPPLGLPQGVSFSDAVQVLPVAVSCLVLIIAQSAATARSFAMKHGRPRRHQPRPRRAHRRQRRRGPVRHVRGQRQPDQDRDPRRAGRPQPGRTLRWPPSSSSSRSS